MEKCVGVWVGGGEGVEGGLEKCGKVGVGGIRVRRVGIGG